MKHRLILDAGRLASELADLPALDRRELMEKWRILYGTEPPYGVRNNFLRYAIAHRMQELAHGGLEPATRRFLEKTAEDHAWGKQSVRSISTEPGTRLLREWHGKTYEVIILKDGVQCNGTCYRSLSEVARAITGTRWSGPLFFGLKKKEAA